jgi:hypothetical protein
MQALVTFPTHLKKIPCQAPGRLCPSQIIHRGVSRRAAPFELESSLDGNPPVSSGISADGDNW